MPFQTINFHGIQHYDRDRFPHFDVIAYHDHCTDGIMAAAVACSFNVWPNDLTKFVPVQYGQDLPEEITKGGGRILFVDFCPEREQLSQIAGAWADYFVIDHHKSRDWTAEAPWVDHVFYSSDCSGAFLTWRWFTDKEAPQIVQYVQDRDLWQWKLPRSREVSAALGEEPKTVDRFLELLFSNPHDLFATGEILLRSRTRAARSLAAKAFLLVLDPMFGTRAVNATENISEVGEEILRAFPSTEVACVFFQPNPEEIQLSFRSRAHDPGRWTALDAASSLGGGGTSFGGGGASTTTFGGALSLIFGGSGFGSSFGGSSTFGGGGGGGS